MFGIKKRRELKRQQEIAEQQRLAREREQHRIREEEERANLASQTRMKANASLNRMKRDLDKFDKMKRDNIERAKKARKEGNELVYRNAKCTLKSCVAQQQRLEAMYCQLEGALQNADMNKVVANFVQSASELSEQMKQIVPELDIKVAQQSYTKALTNIAKQYQVLDEFLESAVDNMEVSGLEVDSISDDEIDRLINNQIIDEENGRGKEIDDMIYRCREALEKEEN